MVLPTLVTVPLYHIALAFIHVSIWLNIVLRILMRGLRLLFWAVQLHPLHVATNTRTVDVGVQWSCIRTRLYAATYHRSGPYTPGCTRILLRREIGADHGSAGYLVCIRIRR